MYAPYSVATSTTTTTAIMLLCLIVLYIAFRCPLVTMSLDRKGYTRSTAEHQVDSYDPLSGNTVQR